MKLYDLERVETELGVDLPQDYREFILSFKRPRAQHNQTLLEALSEGAFNALIVDRPSALIKVNEATVEIGPIEDIDRLAHWQSSLKWSCVIPGIRTDGATRARFRARRS